MLNYIKLNWVGPSASMHIDFARRLTLLTGDNGVGKTFALDLAWWALTRTWSGRPAFPQRGKGVKPLIEYQVWGKSGLATPVQVKFDFQNQYWALPSRRPPMPGVVLYARVEGSFSLWDPARNYWTKTSPDWPAAYHFDRKSLWDGLRNEDHILCNGLIRDLVTWQLQGGFAFETFCNVLEILSPSDDRPLRPGKPMRVSIDDARDIPTLVLPYGTVPVTHISAGMRRVLGMAYLMVWFREEHKEASALLNQAPDDRFIVLFDEVETHLHPRWQRHIVPALLEAARGVGGDGRLQCIASTHSPLVMASVEPIFEPKQDRRLNLDPEELPFPCGRSNTPLEQENKHV